MTGHTSADHLAAHARRRATALAAGVREDAPDRLVAAVTDRLTRDELVALVAVLAAMVPADVDPGLALAWVEHPPSAWPDAVVVREAGRHDDGATDRTAVLGRIELDRRFTATAARARLALVSSAS